MKRNPTPFDFIPAILSQPILDIFKAMEIAEEEIARAQSLYPDRSAEIWNAFRVFIPPPCLRSKPNLSRLYVRELCGRIGQGAVPEQAIADITDAEMLAVLCDASLIGPLRYSMAALYAELFVKHFGPVDEVSTLTFAYPEQRQEAIREVCKIARKMRAK